MKYKKENSSQNLGNYPKKSGTAARRTNHNPLQQLGTQFIGASTLEQIYHELLEAIDKTIGGGAISLMIVDERSGNLKVAATRNIDGERLRELEKCQVKIGEKISGWVYQSGTPLILNRVTQQESEIASRLTRDDLTASISFPLVAAGKIIGVINVSQTEAEARYSETDLELISVLVRLAVLAVENLRLAQQNQEAARVRTLFEQYVSADVAELLMQQKSELLNLGSVQELTILFADIRNFTSLLQYFKLQQLRSFLNDFFTRFSTRVFENRGTLDKFMGDAALVIFGAPAPHDAPEQAAVATAISILQDFEALRSRWFPSDQGFEQIGLGIGISCGEMFIGNVGSSIRLDYTVIGSEVNIAQRLASNTQGDAILITEPIRRALSETVMIKKTESKKLRGLPDEILIHTVDYGAKTEA